MVPAGRARPGPQAYPDGLAAVVARIRRRPPRDRQVSRRKAEAALVWNTAVWGATFVVVKAALADVSPILFVALRFSLATLALMPLLAGKRRIPWDWRTAGAGALAGACLFSGYLTQTLGLRLTSAPKSAFIRSEEHTSELQSLRHLVCRLLLEKKKKK